MEEKTINARRAIALPEITQEIISNQINRSDGALVGKKIPLYCQHAQTGAIRFVHYFAETSYKFLYIVLTSYIVDAIMNT